MIKSLEPRPPRAPEEDSERLHPMDAAEFCAYARRKGFDFTLDESQEILIALDVGTTPPMMSAPPG